MGDVAPSGVVPIGHGVGWAPPRSGLEVPLCLEQGLVQRRDPQRPCGDSILVEGT